MRDLCYCITATDILKAGEVVCFVKPKEGRFLFLKNTLGDPGFLVIAKLTQRKGIGFPIVRDEAIVVVRSVNPPSFQVYHVKNGHIQAKDELGKMQRISVRDFVALF
jgi:hypothetical protein